MTAFPKPLLPIQKLSKLLDYYVSTWTEILRVDYSDMPVSAFRFLYPGMTMALPDPPSKSRRTEAGVRTSARLSVRPFIPGLEKMTSYRFSTCHGCDPPSVSGFNFRLSGFMDVLDAASADGNINARPDVAVQIR